MSAAKRQGRSTGIVRRFRIHTQGADKLIRHHTHEIVALNFADAWKQVGAVVQKHAAETKVVNVRLLA